MNSLTKFRFPFVILLCLTLGESNCQTIADVMEFYDSKDFTGGVDYIVKHYKSFENDAYANYMLGEMGLSGENWEKARIGYERALQLIHPNEKMDFHEKIYRNDNEIYWYANDGLGFVFYMQNDFVKSLAALETANQWLHVVRVDPLDEAKHYYNLACAYALNKKSKKAVDALREAIKTNPDYKRKARTESDFDSLQEFAPFVNLLEDN
jgi:tetratricopeptide (TPR) repeat protein